MRFPLAQVTGFDASRGDDRPKRARACPSAHFAVADVTQPLLLPADVVYARLLLGHLPDPTCRARDVGEVAAPGQRHPRVRGTGALPQRRSRSFARYEER